MYSKENIEIYRELKKAIAWAWREKIPILSGVGNTGQFAPVFIGDDWRTITVAPHNIHGEISMHHSFSFSIDIFAPGGSRKLLKNRGELEKYYPKLVKVFRIFADYDDPICAIGRDSYSFLTLGSGALPHVTGAVAMIKSFIPDAKVEDIRCLLSSATIPLKPAENLMEGLSGRLSLRLLKTEIRRYLREEDFKPNN